ncbi:MAG: hypothetical protein IJH67_11590 [Thermoguttaceae bacterium]|nr:hypothetical protein [Thermoguttaceae bacterium]
MNRIISSILVCMLTLAVVVGCGSGAKKGPTVKWSGTVTIEGQPLPSNAQGQIVVQSNNATGASRGDQADIVNGSYSLQSVPKGEVTVSFNIYTTAPAKNQSDAERGLEDTTNIVPDRWLQGVVDTADKNDSAKNFDLTK